MARTLIDLAASEPRALEYAFAGAERRGLLDLDDLDAVIARSKGRRGVARVRLLRAEFALTPEFTRSQDERAFLHFCVRYEIPRPKANLWVSVPNDGFEVDFCWPRQRVIVEIDSSWHDDTLARKRESHTPEDTAARIKVVIAPNANLIAHTATRFAFG